MGDEIVKDDPVARWMYDRAFDNYKVLADIRFKLLAIVPIISGIGLALQSALDDRARIVLGGVGAVVTLGLIFYEQRNSSHYDDAVGVAKRIEAHLRERGLLPAGVRGVFTSRAEVPARRFLGVFKMWHDRALAIIYATAFGAWVFVASAGGVRVLGLGWQLPPLIAALAALVVFLELWRLNPKS